jgi:hypothetical protein
MESLTQDVPLISKLRYDELSVGMHFGPFSERIDESLCASLEVQPGNGDDSRPAPAGVFPALFLRAYRKALGGVVAGALLAREELEFHGTVPVGVEVTIDVWISDKYRKRNRPYVVMEFRLNNLPGRLLVSGRKIIVWPTEANARPR